MVKMRFDPKILLSTVEDVFYELNQLKSWNFNIWLSVTW